ncbi:hypothetical protein AKJ45_00645 [candidate division MSBL1 archaeon SCGC-AAA261F19]|uniref:Exosome complex component Rrp4 n=1 Tax=candidate division MSBL1 archaeon SCGC-AAA261F19 TaxID=1698275 RepID=A0A133VBF6_9EURY|nr:hypothetical protein AKJ45_00645 [candidate division MSBL1 archaeon SCGC-AAA261F19]
MMVVEERELVVPGQLIAKGDYSLHGGVFRDGEEIRASKLGLVDKRKHGVRVIPLEGRYIPKAGDKVIGVVTDSYYAGWLLDINSPYPGNLTVSSLLQRKVDLSEVNIDKYLGIGDVVFARIQDVDELMKVRLEVTREERGKITGGQLVEILPSRIPRVIGRKGSMISVLEEIGECELLVGQNGRVVVISDDLERRSKVVEALFKIEREAHISGLTDRVWKFLERKE